MEEWLTRIWTDMVGRTTGPMTFRLILQPLTAIIFAVRDGLKDARAGRPYFVRALIHDPVQRPTLLREALKAVGKVLVLAVVMDVIYEFIVFRRFYLLETLLVAAILAFLPYLLLRGITNRLARLGRRGAAAEAPETVAVPRDSKQV